MKVIITGGAGYIGSHVVLAALDRGWDVTVFDNLSTANKNNINKKTNFVKGSINSKDDLSKLFTNNKTRITFIPPVVEPPIPPTNIIVNKII